MNKILNSIKLVWLLLEHIPPLIVIVPYTSLHWLWRITGNILLIFGVYTFKLQYWLMPSCCKQTLDETLDELESRRP